MSDATITTQDSKKGLFKISLFGWGIFALWALLNTYGLFKKAPEINSYALGYFAGQVFIPLVVAWILALVIWFIFRRSQKAARITFNLVLILLIWSSLSAKKPVEQQAPVVDAG